MSDDVVTVTDADVLVPTTNVPLSSFAAASDEAANETAEDPAAWAWKLNVATSVVDVMSGCDGVMSTIEAVPALLLINADLKIVPNVSDF